MIACFLMHFLWRGDGLYLLSGIRDRKTHFPYGYYTGLRVVIICLICL